MFGRCVASLVAMAGMVVVGTTLIVGSAHAGGGGCHEPLTDGRGTNVDLKGGCIITTLLHIDAGDTVTFTNRDEAQHTVTGASNSWGSTAPLSQEQSVTHRFKKNGVYPYFCLLHAGMIGAIVVGDGSGPGAATGDGGAPAGVVRTEARDVEAAASTVNRNPNQDSGPWMIALIAGGLGLIAMIATVVWVRSGRKRVHHTAAS